MTHKRQPNRRGSTNSRQCRREYVWELSNKVPDLRICSGEGGTGLTAYVNKREENKRSITARKRKKWRRSYHFRQHGGAWQRRGFSWNPRKRKSPFRFFFQGIEDVVSPIICYQLSKNSSVVALGNPSSPLHVSDFTFFSRHKLLGLLLKVCCTFQNEGPCQLNALL